MTIKHGQPPRLTLTVTHSGGVELHSCEECGQSKDVVLMLLRVAERILEYPEADLGPIESEGI